MPTTIKNADATSADTQDKPESDAGSKPAPAPAKSKKVRRRYRVQLMHPRSYMLRGVLIRRGDIIEVGARDRNYLVRERGNFEDVDDNAPRGDATVPEDDDRTIERVYRFQDDSSDFGEETPVKDARRHVRNTASNRRRRQRARRTGSEIANARARASMPDNFEADDDGVAV